MFWRIVRRLLHANPARLATVLLALGAGAAVSAALLNLKVDAERRLTTEFRAFGANVLITPRESVSSPAQGAATLNLSKLPPLPEVPGGKRVAAVAFLYLIADVHAGSSEKLEAIVAGHMGSGLPELFPGSWNEEMKFASRDEPNCQIGTLVSQRLKLRPGAELFLRSGSREENCRVSTIVKTGGPEDSQVFVDLDVAQRLAGLRERVSLIQLSIAGTPAVIANYISVLAEKYPDARVQGIRQFTETEAKLYERIRGLLTATVALILVLTALCVMAAMTNAAMERQHDVGLMKAIGGPVNRVLRLFLMEAAILGVAGGVLGAAAGIGLSVWLGKAVFGIAARPRLIVYPFTVAVTILVAIAGAFPLRRLASVKPAVIFRGEA